jgi:hypothetical protein
VDLKNQPGYLSEVGNLYDAEPSAEPEAYLHLFCIYDNASVSLGVQVHIKMVAVVAESTDKLRYAFPL